MTGLLPVRGDWGGGVVRMGVLLMGACLILYGIATEGWVVLAVGIVTIVTTLVITDKARGGS